MFRSARGSAALAALAVTFMLAAGCADQGPTAVELRPDGLRVGVVANVLRSPSRHNALHRVQLIDSAGGTINFGIGSITFPRGSVGEPTLISAAVDGTSMAVTFSPHGLEFSADALPQLSFSFSGLAASPDRLQIVYLRPDWRVAELLPTLVVETESIAVTGIAHFSTYAMGAH